MKTSYFMVVHLPKAEGGSTCHGRSSSERHVSHPISAMTMAGQLPLLALASAGQLPLVALASCGALHHAGPRAAFGTRALRRTLHPPCTSPPLPMPHPVVAPPPCDCPPLAVEAPLFFSRGEQAPPRAG